MKIPLVILVAAGLIATSAARVAGQELVTRDRDPAVALGFAWLCPGCGHLYSGETTKGALIAAISIGSLAGGVAIQLARRPEMDCRSYGRRFDCVERNTSLTPILVGGAIGLAGYVYGLIDAVPSVRRMRARNGIGLGRIDVKPTLAMDGGVGLQLTLRPEAKQEVKSSR